MGRVMTAAKVACHVHVNMCHSAEDLGSTRRLHEHARVKLLDGTYDPFVLLPTVNHHMQATSFLQSRLAVAND